MMAGLPNLKYQPNQRTAEVMADPESVGFSVSPSPNLSVSSRIDFDALKAFVNKYTDSLAREDNVSLHSADRSLGANLRQFVDGDFKDKGLAAHFSKGGFKARGGVSEESYDGHKLSSTKEAHLGYNNDRFGVDGGFVKVSPAWGNDQITKSIKGRYDGDQFGLAGSIVKRDPRWGESSTIKSVDAKYTPNKNSAFTFGLKQRNSESPSVNLNYNTKF